MIYKCCYSLVHILINTSSSTNAHVYFFVNNEQTLVLPTPTIMNKCSCSAQLPLDPSVTCASIANVYFCETGAVKTTMK